MSETRSLLVVFIGFFCFFGVELSCCAEQYIGQPVATQSYHSVDDSSSDQSQDATSSSQSKDSAATTSSAGSSAGSEDDEMARVKEIEAQSKLKQQQQALSGSASSSAAQGSPSTSIIASGSANQTYQTLQTEIARLGQINVASVNKINAQIDGLTQQNQMLEQEVKQLQSAVQSLLTNKPTGNVPVATSGFSSTLFFSWILVLSLLLILSWVYLIAMMRRIARPLKNKSVTDSDDEYNFMSTKEAIPAKLDLARAYIQMDDIDQATAVLKEIIQHADDAHRATAEALLHGLTQSKDAPKND